VRSEPAAEPEPAAAVVVEAPPATSPSTPGSLPQQLDKVERRLLLDALARTRYNRTQAADLLGLTLRQLRYRMQRLQIHDSE
jgi:two-component system response regulator PilR (NtrC family)